MRTSLAILVLTLFFTVACDDGKNTLRVTATAYTSHVDQTNAKPTLAAWGDTLSPGMKAIAVSRDLIELGLDHGVEVKIEGLSGTYTVLDKMNARWTKKIDIYMGKDLKSAEEWGEQMVEIKWDKP